MRYRLAIFDFDGTLADSFPWVIGMMNDVAVRFKFRRVEEDEVESLRMCDAREIMRRLGIRRWKLPMIAHYVRTRMAADVDQIRLFPGTGEMLRQLSDAGVKLAVVSANGEQTIRAVLGEHASLFQAYSGGVSLFGKRSKLMRMSRLIGVPAGETLVIGDEIRDLDATRAARMTFGAVSWGSTRPAAMLARSPDYLFDAVPDITKAVLGDA
ncbi:MAG: putative phosphoglycolate phosphatase [Caulobacteraceae bacterium]|nr:putative phosphoglycolate phosphatase [Caulobacteraceae bacterium]